jgi:low temperature requirement protein LtrA
VRVPSVLRDRDAEPGVTTMELFFDVVYVFAVTQLSHTLVEHLSVRGAIETLVLFAAVWWAWQLTAWSTNWIDPDTLPCER